MSTPGRIGPEAADRWLDEAATLPATARAGWLAALHADRDAALDALLESAERRMARELALVTDAIDAIHAAAHAAGAGIRAARASRILAHSLAYGGRLEDALTAADRSRAEAIASGSAVDAARADVASMHPLAKSGRPFDAADRGMRARESFRAAGEPVLAARADVNLANVLRLLGRNAEALASLDAALPVLGGDAHVAGQIENSRGEVLLALGRIADAEVSFMRASELLGRARQGFAAGLVLGNLADLRARAGQAASALASFAEARSLLAEEGAGGHAARLDVEEAELLETIGAADDALESARRASIALERIGHAWECARAEDVIARSLLALGRSADAALAAERASQRWQRLGNPAQASLALLPAAAADAAEGRAEDAVKRADAAVASTDDEVARARANQLAAAWAVEAALADAPARVLGAVEDARRLGIAPLIADSLETRAALRLAEGDAAGAGEDAIAAIGITEELRGSLQAERLRGAAIGRRSRVAAIAVKAAIRSGSPAAALEAVERTRDRGLLDSMLAAAGASDDPAARALEAELEAAYARLTRPPRQGERRIVLDEWRSTVRDIESRLESRRPVTEPRAALAPSAAAAALRPGEVILAWHADGDAATCFAVHPSGEIDATVACSTADARAAADRLGFLLRRPALACSPQREERMRREIDECAARLRELLLDPLPEAARRAPVRIVVPYGPLCDVPFHALERGSGAPCTSYSPSLSAFVERRRRPGASAAGALSALVVSVADSFAPRIESEGAEIAAILRLAGADVTELGGAHATAAAFAEAAPRASLLHVATHGRFDSAHPAAAGIRMADRWIGARELARLGVAGANVVLSGCETGRVHVGPGHETSGVLRALCGAGIAQAIATMWSTHDADGAALMTAFHRAWSVSPTSANQRTMSDLLHELQRDADNRGVPFAHWAAFFALAP